MVQMGGWGNRSPLSRTKATSLAGMPSYGLEPNVISSHTVTPADQRPFTVKTDSLVCECVCDYINMSDMLDVIGTNNRLFTYKIFHYNKRKWWILVSIELTSLKASNEVLTRNKKTFFISFFSPVLDRFTSSWCCFLKSAEYNGMKMLN